MFCEVTLIRGVTLSPACRKLHSFSLFFFFKSNLFKKTLVS